MLNIINKLVFTFSTRPQDIPHLVHKQTQRKMEKRQPK